MKKAILYFICLGFVFLAAPVISFAFDTYECGEQEITVWGFVRNNLGMFEGTQEFTNSGNQLATARTWLRTYLDWKMSEHFKFYANVQFIYEPWYKVEEGTTQSENGGPQQHRRSGWKTYSEFDDVNDVIREVYIEWRPNNKSSIKFGRQIAIWGEALTNPVGDVIQPTDSRFAFAFANIEDTRIPQYMIRGIHDIDSLRSSFEWIINPLLTEGKYTVNRTAEYANQNSDDGAEQRFAIHPEDRFYPGITVSPATRPWNIPGQFNWGDLSSLVSWPIASSFYRWMPSFIPGVGNTWLPSELPYVHTKYPDNFEDTRFGFRTSTLLNGFQFGVSYWHTQNYDVIIERGGIVGQRLSNGTVYPLREYTISYPTMDIIGFYMNKQLPWPGIIRAEMIYAPNKPYNTFNIMSDYVSLMEFRFGPGFPRNNYAYYSSESAVVRRDYVKYMLAYDLNSFFFFDWHKTASFDVTFEHQGEWVPDSSDLKQAIYSYTKVPNYHASFNLRISTNWYYNRLATDVVFGYDTFGNSGMFMPSVKWMPGWMNSKFSAELKYIGIYGDNDYEGLGMFRKKDMLILTTQFNF